MEFQDSRAHSSRSARFRRRSAGRAHLAGLAAPQPRRRRICLPGDPGQVATPGAAPGTFMRVPGRAQRGLGRPPAGGVAAAPSSELRAPSPGPRPGRLRTPFPASRLVAQAEHPRSYLAERPGKPRGRRRSEPGSREQEAAGRGRESTGGGSGAAGGLGAPGGWEDGAQSGAGPARAPTPGPWCSAQGWERGGGDLLMT